MTSSRRALVEAYVAASQKARSTHAAEDLELLRSFLADDVTIRLAGPWTPVPWRTVGTSADALVARLQAPINTAVSLTTENVDVSWPLATTSASPPADRDATLHGRRRDVMQPGRSHDRSV